MIARPRFVMQMEMVLRATGLARGAGAGSYCCLFIAGYHDERDGCEDGGGQSVLTDAAIQGLYSSNRRRPLGWLRTEDEFPELFSLLAWQGRGKGQEEVSRRAIDWFERRHTMYRQAC